MEFTISKAGFRRCVLAVKDDIHSELTEAWSRELLTNIERTSAETQLTQDDIWTYAHQAFPDVPDFGTRLRNRIITIMERLADAIDDDPDVVSQ